MADSGRRITVRERATSIAWKLHLLREEAKRYAALVAAGWYLAKSEEC